MWIKDKILIAQNSFHKDGVYQLKVKEKKSVKENILQNERKPKPKTVIIRKNKNFKHSKNLIKINPAEITIMITIFSFKNKLLQKNYCYYNNIKQIAKTCYKKVKCKELVDILKKIQL